MYFILVPIDDYRITQHIKKDFKDEVKLSY